MAKELLTAQQLSTAEQEESLRLSTNLESGETDEKDEEKPADVSEILLDLVYCVFLGRVSLIPMQCQCKTQFFSLTYTQVSLPAEKLGETWV